MTESAENQPVSQRGGGFPNPREVGALSGANIRTPTNKKHSRSSIEAALVEFWSVRVPRWLNPDLPLLGDAFADGVWTAVWPPVAAYLPVAALLIGFFPPLFTGAISNVYAGSLLFVIVAVAGAVVGGPLGGMFLAGSRFGSFLATFFLPPRGSISELPRHAPRLLLL